VGEPPPPSHPWPMAPSLGNGFISLLEDLVQGGFCPNVPQCAAWDSGLCWRVTQEGTGIWGLPE
jgi:hypothetical protein